MIDFKYSYIGDRDRILSFLKAAKITPNPNNCDLYTIIDIGASADPWDREVLDATLDLKQNNLGDGNHFLGNINDRSGWQEVLDYVEKHGKFSYSICTHTLEDIAYPQLAFEMLPKISEAGFIAMPSYERDLVHIEGPWPGYQHHRWLFVPKDDKVVLVPKIPFVGFIKGIPTPPDERTELQIFWNKELPFEVLNGDYLGPNVECVKNMYLEILGGTF